MSEWFFGSRDENKEQHDLNKMFLYDEIDEYLDEEDRRNQVYEEEEIDEEIEEEEFIEWEEDYDYDSDEYQ